eukprot:411760_1
MSLLSKLKKFRNEHTVLIIIILSLIAAYNFVGDIIFLFEFGEAISYIEITYSSPTQSNIMAECIPFDYNDWFAGFTKYNCTKDWFTDTSTGGENIANITCVSSFTFCDAFETDPSSSRSWKYALNGADKFSHSTKIIFDDRGIMCNDIKNNPETALNYQEIQNSDFYSSLFTCLTATNVCNDCGEMCDYTSSQLLFGGNISGQCMTYWFDAFWGNFSLVLLIVIICKEVMKMLFGIAFFFSKKAQQDNILQFTVNSPTIAACILFSKRFQNHIIQNKTNYKGTFALFVDLFCEDIPGLILPIVQINALEYVAILPIISLSGSILSVLVACLELIVYLYGDYNDAKQTETNVQIQLENTDDKYSLIRSALKQHCGSDWEQYLANFKNEEVTDSRINMLNEKILKELIPKIGPRMEFQQWMEQQTQS